MRFDSLDAWLAWQETLHPSEIELGLERVNQVYKKLQSESLTSFVITVAGTNGKGTCVSLLERIYIAAGYKVGTYTSPHLYHYNERIRLNGEAVSDETICAAFEKVDQARLQDEGEISLTYFEFGTLAALTVFHDAQPDVVILEVGMGGRLDAVNIIDADIALVTSIALDHQQWLGETRDEIAYEKAGIMRPEHPVVYADEDCPTAIIDFARSLSAPLSLYQKDFAYEGQADSNVWHWHNNDVQVRNLPRLKTHGIQAYKNASAVLQVVILAQTQLPVAHQAIRLGMHAFDIPGRLEIVNSPVMQIFDVAHNEQSIGHLAKWLNENRTNGQTLAVFGMMEDRLETLDLTTIAEQIDVWHISQANIPRAAGAEQIRNKLIETTKSTVICHETLAAAYQTALSMAQEADRLVIFGSFYTVAETRPERI